MQEGYILVLVVLLVLLDVYDVVQVLVLMVLKWLKLAILLYWVRILERLIVIVWLLLSGTWSCNEHGPDMAVTGYFNEHGPEMAWL